MTTPMSTWQNRIHTLPCHHGHLPAMSTCMCVSIFSLLVCSGTLLMVYCLYKRSISPQKSPTINKVIFFPDKATATRLSMKRNGLRLQDSNLMTLMECLQGAKHSLDVCMFTMACRELAEILIKAHQDGIMVRVITDSEQTGTCGSQIRNLRRAGIQVRTDNTTFFMHHKFVLVDRKILINGSLNWTLQGVCGNQENVTISNCLELVEPFTQQFEQLWKMYDPLAAHKLYLPSILQH